MDFRNCLQDGRNKGGKARGKSGGSRSAGGGSLGPADMRALVPENAGNSRVFAASELLAKGDLSQPKLKEIDIENYLGQAQALTSRNIRFMSQNGAISVPVASGSSSVSTANYRRFAAQANRDLRRIYRAANEETKNSWARTLGGNFTGSRNRAVRAIARDLNRRYMGR